MFAEWPATKQTARLNWKDFRLRATLYVTYRKGAQRDWTMDAFGLWRYCDELLFACNSTSELPGKQHTRDQTVTTSGFRPALAKERALPDIPYGGRLAEAQTPREGDRDRNGGADRACVVGLREKNKSQDLHRAAHGKACHVRAVSGGDAVRPERRGGSGGKGMRGRCGKGMRVSQVGTGKGVNVG